jgi:hypothetical protein
MTEEQWLACTNPTPMLKFLRDSGKLTERKARLFAVASCRRIWSLIDSGAYQNIVEVAEEFADDPSDWRHLQAVEHHAYQEAGSPGEDSARWSATHTCGDCVALWPWYHAEDSTHFHAANACENGGDEQYAQTRIVRDLFGNPFLPMPRLDPTLLTANDCIVKRLADAVYENRVLPSGAFDAERLAVLADALEEAAAHHVLLGHLRQQGTVHVRGCWAIDLLVGKE